MGTEGLTMTDPKTTPYGDCKTDLRPEDIEGHVCPEEQDAVEPDVVKALNKITNFLRMVARVERFIKVTKPIWHGPHGTPSLQDDLAALLDRLKEAEAHALVREEKEIWITELKREHKTKADRLARLLDPHMPAHDYEDIENSPSGKRQVRCRLCEQVTTAAIRPSMDPCPKATAPCDRLKATLEEMREALGGPVTKGEIQSKLSRVRWAEGLIRQLPEDHDGRNSWLLNYSQKVIAQSKT